MSRAEGALKSTRGIRSFCGSDPCTARQPRFEDRLVGVASSLPPWRSRHPRCQWLIFFWKAGQQEICRINTLLEEELLKEYKQNPSVWQGVWFDWAGCNCNIQHGSPRRFHFHSVCVGVYTYMAMAMANGGIILYYIGVHATQCRPHTYSRHVPRII